MLSHLGKKFLKSNIFPSTCAQQCTLSLFMSYLFLFIFYLLRAYFKHNLIYFFFTSRHLISGMFQVSVLSVNRKELKIWVAEASMWPWPAPLWCSVFPVLPNGIYDDFFGLIIKVISHFYHATDQTQMDLNISFEYILSFSLFE